MTKQSKDYANRVHLETTRAAARHGLLAEPVGEPIRRWDFTTPTGKLVGLYWPRQRTAWTPASGLAVAQSWTAALQLTAHNG
jgi:hypothetical protein